MQRKMCDVILHATGDRPQMSGSILNEYSQGVVEGTAHGEIFFPANVDFVAGRVDRLQTLECDFIKQDRLSKYATGVTWCRAFVQLCRLFCSGTCGVLLSLGTQALLFQIHSEYIIYRVTRQTLLEAIFILPRIRRVLDDFGDFGDPGDVGDLGDFGDLGHIGLSLPSPSVLLDARLWRNRILIPMEENLPSRR